MSIRLEVFNRREHAFAFLLFVYSARLLFRFASQRVRVEEQRIPLRREERSCRREGKGVRRKSIPSN